MITIKKPKEIEILKEGGKILASIVDQVIDGAKDGVSTLDLEKKAEKLIKKSGGEASFREFNGYPAASCISINDQLVHTIPRAENVIKTGDIVSVDIGLKYKGLFTDMSKTIAIGKVPRKTKKLLEVTEKSLAIGIAEVKPGNTVGDIGFAIQKYVDKFGFSVVRSLVGHGVGYGVHEDPRIPNFGEKGKGEGLAEGMVLALEPMVNIGGPEVVTREDNWTITTADGSLSAHFEHTVVVTGQGAEILTQ